MYVDSLVVPTGSTLDLNGLKLFARVASISGTITGGTVTMLSDGGPMLFSLPTSGRIETAGNSRTTGRSSAAPGRRFRRS